MELIVTVVSVLAVPAIAPPVFAEEDIRKRRPAAAPLVIWIKNGVAGWESAPGVHPALLLEIVLAVTPVIVPATCPLISSVSMRGTEKSVFFLAEPVPAVMPTVTNPTGSVVAVVWPFAPVSRTDEARRAAREKRVMFIHGKDKDLALVVKEFFGLVAKLSHLLISLIMCLLG